MEEVALQDAGRRSLKVSVRPAPTRPKTPVICPAKTESELFLTIGAILRFCTVSTRSPTGRTRRLAHAVEIGDRSRPTIAWTMRARSNSLRRQ